MTFTLNYLSQQDPQWKAQKLGFGKTETIGTDGCTLTCVTMLVNGYGYQETPATLNQKLKDLGEGNGFIGPLIVWGGLPLLYTKLKFENIVLSRDYDAPVLDIDASLAGGQPVIVEVDRSLASGLQNHWVVLYEKQGDDYLMLDPWPYPSDNQPTLLTPRYGFGRPPKKFITAVVWYSFQGIVVPTVPPPATVETDMFVRVVAGLDAGLRLRSQATTASDTLGLEASGTPLRVIEPVETAQPKVGVFNQWIRVRDPQSREGYVAAWYVENMPMPEPSPGDTTAPQRVKPSVGDGLEDVALPAPTEKRLTPPDSASATQKLVADIWNRYGGLLDALSKKLSIEPGVTVATLAIESGGQAFDAGGRMIIRFENHVFYSQWGKNNQDVFNQHFTFDQQQPWTGQKWRPTPDEPWRPPDQPDFHGSQNNEWDVFSFARTLDDEAAKLSISMGAPQVMGFNYDVLGYASVQDMFLAFTAGEREQVVGFFDFIQNVVSNAGAVKALQALDFKKFAGYYNGTGQQDYYAGLIQGSYDAFKQLQTPPAPPEEPQPEPPPEPTPEPAPEPTPEPVTLTVRVSSAVGSSGLRMRAEPSLAGPLVTVLKANTELTVLEDAATAQPKIGQQGQWLNVKDNKGNEGYVAAWYVVAAGTTPTPSPAPEPTPSPEPSPSPSPAPEPDTTELRVKVSASVGASGLRMRSQPSLAGSLVTLEKTLTSLLVLEDPAIARPKIGVTNQWLNVRDPKGYEGYVAAWYVVLDTTTPPSDTGTTPSTPPSQPAGDLVVYVSTLAYNGLRMRSGPSTGTPTLKVLMPNTALTVLEANAESKVGIFNQWLNVRDPGGTEGYVAAWYVRK